MTEIPISDVLWLARVHPNQQRFTKASKDVLALLALKKPIWCRWASNGADIEVSNKPFTLQRKTGE